MKQKTYYKNKVRENYSLHARLPHETARRTHGTISARSRSKPCGHGCVSWDTTHTKGHGGASTSSIKFFHITHHADLRRRRQKQTPPLTACRGTPRTRFGSLSTPSARRACTRGRCWPAWPPFLLHPGGPRGGPRARRRCSTRPGSLLARASS